MRTTVLTKTIYRGWLIPFIICFLLVAVSCGNLFNSPENDSGGNSVGTTSPRAGTAIISGSINPGALPSSLANAANSQGTSSESFARTAFPASPSLGGDTLNYIVTAVNTASGSSETYNGTSTFDNGERTYSVGIPITENTKNYKITVEVKTPETNVTILTGESEAFPISLSNPVESSNDITLSANNSSGQGLLALDVTVDNDTGINSAKAVDIDSGEEICVADISGTTYTFAAGSIDDTSFTGWLPAGARRIKFEFYSSDDCSGDSVYYFCQTANIFNGLTTDTWVKNSNEPYFFNTTSGGVASTTCRITKAIKQTFELTEIVVDNSRQTTNPSAANYTTGKGSQTNPVTTFDDAIAKLVNKDKDYTIFIKGTLTGVQEIPDTLTDIEGSGTYHAKSVTICGLTGLSEGVPQDVLDAEGSGTVLTISTSVPVKIKNLRITGGNTTGNGGGINMASGTNVTLESGALIGGTNETDPISGTAPSNSTDSSANNAAKGGGIYSEGNLTLKNGSAVIYNYASGNDSETSGGGGGIYCNGGSLTIEAGAKVNLNGTYNFGGGISINNGSAFSMTGGEVCNNISTYGGAGGIYIGGTCPALMTIENALISGNTADIHGDAGGLLYDGGEGKTLSITGNTIISGNHCAFEGGGIRIASGILDLSGNTLIRENYSLVTDGRAGGVASIHQSKIQISGSVYIPSGATIDNAFTTGPRCNDVRSNHNSIMIKGALTPPAECTNGIIAAVNPNSTERGTAVLEADGTNVTDISPYQSYFALTNAAAGWTTKLSEDNTKLLLDLPIYVQQGGTATVGDTGAGTRTNPFGSISDACQLMSESTIDYTILVNGIDDSGTSIPLAGSQTIPSTGISAHSIIIKGANGLYPEGHANAGDPKDVISGTSGAPVLTAECACDVYLADIKLTGAINTGDGEGSYGGGVRRKNGKLFIQNGTLISDNQAHKGGGVALISASLYMSGGTICENNVHASGTDANGGGIYAYSSSIFMYGSALVGGVTGSNPSYPTSMSSNALANTCSNYGAGIYLDQTSKLYLGYNSASGSEGTPTSADVEELTGGILGNYCIKDGGGVYMGAYAKLYMNSGNISYNATSTSSTCRGGGIGTTDSTKVIISGGKIHKNASTYGGGLDISSSAADKVSHFDMTGGEITDNTASYGGGVYIKTIYSSFIMRGGNISGNGAANGYGGGIYNDGMTFICESAIIGDVNSVDSLSGTNGASNTAGYGGGICNAQMLYLGYDQASSTTYLPVNEKEWTGRICRNSADSGAGIYNDNGTLFMNTGTIRGNYSSGSLTNGGGIFSINTSSIVMSGGVIQENRSKNNNEGSAVYIASGSFKLSGYAYIPPESDGSNDVYLANEKTIEIAGALTPTSTGKSGGTEESAVASIKFSSSGYVETRSILTKGSSTSTSDFEAACNKFNIISLNSDRWYISTSGQLVKYRIGSKNSPDSVGDIVFTDGTAVAYSDDLVLTEEQQENAIAVIIHKDGANLVGMGISELPQASFSYGGSSAVGASQTDGKSNMESVQLLSDWSSLRYPIFWSAVNSYSSFYCSCLQGTAYEDEWYIPSITEWQYVTPEIAAIFNNAVAKLGSYGASLRDDKSNWSSSSDPDNTEKAFTYAYYSDTPVSSATKAVYAYGRVFHDFP